MGSLWSQYFEDQQAEERAVQAVVTYLEMHIRVVEQESINKPSFLAPIH